MTRLSALLILGLLVVAGCALPPTAQPTPKPVAAKHVVVGMPVTPPNLPHVGVYLARDLGYFAEEGLDVEIKSFESGVQVLRGGIAGDIDVVGSSSEPVVAAIAQGANLKVIYSYAHALTVSLVVQDAIKTPADLRGKNMGIQDVGAFREMMSRVVLKQAGLTPEDVHYVPVASANYIQGLLSGQIDTAVLHVDQALNAQSRQAGLHQLVNLWEMLPTYFYGAFIISPDKMRDNPTLAPSFVKAVMRAHRFMYANRDKTIEMASKLTNVPPEVLGPAYDQLTAAGVFPVNDGLPVPSIEGTIKTLRELGTLQPAQNMTAEQLVDRGPADQAVKALGAMSGDPRWK